MVQALSAKFQAGVNHDALPSVIFVIGTRGSGSHALCERAVKKFGYHHVKVRAWLESHEKDDGNNGDITKIKTEEVLQYIHEQLDNSSSTWKDKNLIISGFPR